MPFVPSPPKHGLQRQIHVPLVHLRNEDAGQAGHGAMDGMLGEHGAVVAVERVGLLGPDGVRRIDVLDGQRFLLLLAVSERNRVA